jgi:ABC-2 type transport system permease protein
MRKYLAVARITISNILEYRWNFLIGHLRSIVLLVMLYYLWTSVFSKNNNLFGYGLAQIITYVLLVTIIRAIVLNSRTDNISGEISGGGKFFTYLLQPIGYLRYWFTIDVVYKIIDLVVAIIEVILLALIVKATLFLQTNPVSILLFLASLTLATLLYFFLSALISYVTFWTYQGWGIRFAFVLFLEFSAGAFFPLNVLPVPFVNFLKLTPFPYLVFFPINIYLGKVNFSDLVFGFSISALWLAILFLTAKVVWKRGLKIYEAAGG